METPRLRCRSPPRKKSFNGATAFRPWKRLAWSMEYSVGMGLQWSHSLSAMETRYDVAALLVVIVLQWSHSLSAMETAFSFLQFHRCPYASMEPQPFGHGNETPLRLAVVEVRASMEPQPFGHGNNVTPPSGDVSYTASMEPQPFGHGNSRIWPVRIWPLPGFNGATAFRPWKLPVSITGPHNAVTCFNGATAFRPWKRGG